MLEKEGNKEEAIMFYEQASAPGCARPVYALLHRAALAAAPWAAARCWARWATVRAGGGATRLSASYKLGTAAESELLLLPLP